jgi:serine/threonine-protein kinase
VSDGVTTPRRRSRGARPLAALALALLAAGVACGSTAPPKVIAPLPGFTMPPEWTPTPEPAIVSVPGWQTLSGDQIELMLPPSYEGGNPVVLGEELADVIDDNPATVDIAQAIRDNPAGYRLLAIDRETGSIVAVTAREVPTSVSITEYVDKVSEAMLEEAPGSALIQKGVVPFREGEAGWMLFEFTGDDGVGWQLTYAVRHGDFVWNFNFGAVREDYPLLQPIFDQSLQTVVFTP